MLENHSQHTRQNSREISVARLGPLNQNFNFHRISQFREILSHEAAKLQANAFDFQYKLGVFVHVVNYNLQIVQIFSFFSLRVLTWYIQPLPKKIFFDVTESQIFRI